MNNIKEIYELKELISTIDNIDKIDDNYEFKDKFCELFELIKNNFENILNDNFFCKVFELIKKDYDNSSDNNDNDIEETMNELILAYFDKNYWKEKLKDLGGYCNDEDTEIIINDDKVEFSATGWYCISINVKIINANKYKILEMDSISVNGRGSDYLTCYSVGMTLLEFKNSIHDYSINFIFNNSKFDSSQIKNLNEEQIFKFDIKRSIEFKKPLILTKNQLIQYLRKNLVS